MESLKASLNSEPPQSYHYCPATTVSLRTLSSNSTRVLALHSHFYRSMGQSMLLGSFAKRWELRIEFSAMIDLVLNLLVLTVSLNCLGSGSFTLLDSPSSQDRPYQDFPPQASIGCW